MTENTPIDWSFRKIGERHVDRDQDRQALIGERIKNVATAILAVAVLFGVADVRTMQIEYYDKHPIRSDDAQLHHAIYNPACPQARP